MMKGESENSPRAISLRQLNRLIAGVLTRPELQGVWVVAELSDLRVSGGHAYMELIDKNPSTGAVEARMRGIIWASVFGRLSAMFLDATGQRLATGLKVMVCGSVNYHPSYGISFVITAIDPAYTMGEAERLRREILLRLQREGVLELNRQIEWPAVALRVAVVSAQGAAGYGDFVNQLYGNPQHLRFTTRLFPAVLQGDRTVPTVIAALEAIAAEEEQWDCVVIIRGGGATSDLAAFDNYELACHVANFPLPVIVGIGHERDVTVLDYVANMRVKTPTAAAEWLVARGNAALDHLRDVAADLVSAAQARIGGYAEQLAYLQGLLPVVPASAVDRARGRLAQGAAVLGGLTGRSIAPAYARLDAARESLRQAVATVIARAADRLDSRATLVDTLSPAATLRRGYAIVRVDGHAVGSVNDIKQGQKFETVVSDGSFTATRI